MSSDKVINSEIDKREEQFLVGRKQQIKMFRDYLSQGIQNGKSIWNIHGTAGVGKSFLLDMFRRKLAEENKVVLALDTYEEMAELDFWLRERLCKRLPETILILIVGRYRLKDQWVLSPALRERILSMPLGHLTEEENSTYLIRSGFTDAELIPFEYRISSRSRSLPSAKSQ